MKQRRLIVVETKNRCIIRYVMSTVRCSRNGTNYVVDLDIKDVPQVIG